MRRKNRKKSAFTLLILVLLLLVFLVRFVLDKTHLSSVVSSLILHNEPQLRQENGKTNVLLLGIGGGTHDGPDLTDTVIFASIDVFHKKITLISIPRDLWIPDLNGKINTAYAIGEEKKHGDGLLLAKAVVSKLLNQPVDYAVRIDFTGFVKAVDLLGGLDIIVARTFDDYAYPIEGKEDDSCGHTDDEIKNFSATASSELDFFPCRFMHIHFDKGLQHMNGETALEYVRSRHALGIEGTDFARSQRQQKVIEELKQKIFSTQTLLNPAKLINLYTLLQSSIDTDITEQEFPSFITLTQQLRQAKIQSGFLDLGDPETNRPGLLINPSPSPDYQFAWVLIPAAGNGNFSDIQKYITCTIADTCVQHATGTPVPTK